MLVSAAYAEGEPDAYVLPLMLVDEDEAEDLLVKHPHAGVLRVDVAARAWNAGPLRSHVGRVVLARVA